MWEMTRCLIQRAEWTTVTLQSSGNCGVSWWSGLNFDDFQSMPPAFQRLLIELKERLCKKSSKVIHLRVNRSHVRVLVKLKKLKGKTRVVRPDDFKDLKNIYQDERGRVRGKRCREVAGQPRAASEDAGHLGRRH